MNPWHRMVVATLALVAALTASADGALREVQVVLTDSAAGTIERVAATYAGTVRTVVDDTTAILIVPSSRETLLSRDPRVQRSALTVSGRASSPPVGHRA